MAGTDEEERRRFVSLLLAGSLSAFLLPLPYGVAMYLRDSARKGAPAPPLNLGPAAEVVGATGYRSLSLGAKRVGIVRTRSGSLRAFNLRCTHAGCLLRWHRNERLFKCHCHGGAFHEDGTVAKLPPERDLEELPLVLRNDNLLLMDKNTDV